MSPIQFPPSAQKSVPLYHSYLIRLWWDESQDSWRAIAQSVQSGELTHFTDLAALFTFLQAQTLWGAIDEGYAQSTDHQ